MRLSTPAIFEFLCARRQRVLTEIKLTAPNFALSWRKRPTGRGAPTCNASKLRTVTKLGGVKLAPGSLPNDHKVIADERS